MSKNQKILYVLIISFLFLFSVTDAGARMETGAVSGTGAQPSNQTQFSKSSQLVKTIANNVLYLENGGSYDLNGVNVTDLTGTSRVSAKKIMADLTFINGVLKEVVLH